MSGKHARRAIRENRARAMLNERHSRKAGEGLSIRRPVSADSIYGLHQIAKTGKETQPTNPSDFAVRLTTVFEVRRLTHGSLLSEVNIADHLHHRLPRSMSEPVEATITRVRDFDGKTGAVVEYPEYPEESLAVLSALRGILNHPDLNRTSPTPYFVLSGTPLGEEPAIRNITSALPIVIKLGGIVPFDPENPS